MWTPKGASLIRGRRLFQTRRLLEEIPYIQNIFSINHKLLLMASYIINSNFYFTTYHSPFEFLQDMKH